jgi:hypothetical protein
MSKRDVAFQSVEQLKLQFKEDCDEASTVNKALTRELEEANKRLSAKELGAFLRFPYKFFANGLVLECKGLEDKLQFFHNSLRAAESKQQETRGSLVEAQVAESLYKQECAQITKHHKVPFT